jgi:predicted acylesterase/phospholipase RssA
VGVESARTDAEHDRPASGDRIAVALSGGGHRACLFGLGVLLYLAEAGKGAGVTSIASVSGGSMANGAVAQSLDFTGPTAAAEMRKVTARVAGQLAGKGSLFAAWPARAYLGLLIVFGALVLIGTWCLPTGIAIRIAIFLLGLLALASLAKLRGRVCAKAFESALFKGGGRPTRLDAIQDELDHVFCATDLHAGENVYFSRDFVLSYRFGSGVPADIGLAEVVQASAAFPGAFPVTSLPTGRHQFVDPGEPEAAKTRRMALVDGGVYDNMGDEWAQGELNDKERRADELIVVNASAGLAWDPLRGLKVPVYGELSALLRDKSVLYDNGNSQRLKVLRERFTRADKGEHGLRGAIVYISRSPFKIPHDFAHGNDECSRRAHAALALLQGSDPDLETVEKGWTEVAKDNAAIKTTLRRTDPADAARLMHHAYVMAMVNLHVILGYPLLDLPDYGRFEKLAAGEPA